jgi:hypothetical protein
VNPVQNQPVTALPNVLSNETIPNTLGGVGEAGSTTGQRAWSGTPTVASIALLAIVVATVAAIATRLG